MTKKVVVRVAARGYVDGRYIGEEKEVIEAVDPSGRGKRGRGKPAGRGGARRSGAAGPSGGSGTQANDDRGNRIGRGAGGGATAGANRARGSRGAPSAGGASGARGATDANARGGRRRSSAGTVDSANRRTTSGGQVARGGQSNQGGRGDRGDRGNRISADNAGNSDGDNRGNANASGATSLAAREARGDKSRRGPRGGRGARGERAQGIQTSSNTEGITPRVDSGDGADGNVTSAVAQPGQERQPRAPRAPREPRQLRQPGQPRPARGEPQGERAPADAPGVRTSRRNADTRGARGARGGKSGIGERGGRNTRGEKNRSIAQPRGGAGVIFGGEDFGNSAAPHSAQHETKPGARRNRGGKKTPFRVAANSAANSAANNAGNHAGMASGNGNRALISEVAETMRWGADAKSGQFAEALAKEAVVKRERLHKVLAQSGHGSRRDMEIMITSGRVMVNGIVATTGTSISASDAVMIDKRLVKLKFDEALPRVLLYHKPDGEIVTTSDPGNRITVFDNLPRVENGKWMSIGRLDINTSGLLIFTTSGELANRLMHPRYEIEREYAVRILGELTEADTERLLAGITIDTLARPVKPSKHGADNALELNDSDVGDDDDDDDEAYEGDFADDDDANLGASALPDVDADVGADLSADARNSASQAAAIAMNRPAKFDSIEARGGEGANHWYHVVLREGRNREVRKMFEAVGLTVSRLMRVRFGKIGLPPRLTRGRMMELDDSQIRAVLRWVGMEVDGHIGALPSHLQAAPSSSAGKPNRGQRQPQKDGVETPRVRQARNENAISASKEPDETTLLAADSTAEKNTLDEQVQGQAEHEGHQRNRRGSRNSRGARGQRQPRAAGQGGAMPAVEGEDYVAGEAAIRDYARALEMQEGQDAPNTTADTADTNATRRQPRRGPGRNVRRPREVSDVGKAADIGNVGNAAPLVLPTIAPVFAANNADIAADRQKTSRVKREPPETLEPSEAREPSAVRAPKKLPAISEPGNASVVKRPRLDDVNDGDDGDNIGNR